MSQLPRRPMMIDPVTGLPIPVDTGIDPTMGMGTPPPAQPPGVMSKIQSILGGPQGMMNLGSSLMAASGPSPVKQGFGSILGQSLLQNQQFKQQQGDSELKKMLLMSQIQKNKQKQQQNRTHVIGNALVDDQGNVVYQGSALDNTFGRVNPGDYSPESLAKFQQSGDWKDLQRVWAPVNPTVQMVGGVPTATQLSRTGGAPQLSPLSTPEAEAEAKRRQAAAQAGGAKTGEAVATAQITLPQVEQNTSEALKAIKDLRKHPGLPYITGLYSTAPIIPGTPQAGADALAQQIQGSVFLQAYESLRGAQAITDVEGKKAEAAKARMQRAQTRRDYIHALDDLESVLNAGIENVRRKANSGAAPRSREDILKQYDVQ